MKDLLKYIKKWLEVPIDNNEDDDSIGPVIISADEASKSLQIIYAFLLQQGNTKEQLKQVNWYINLKKKNSMKQTTMDQFFNIIINK